VDWRINRDGAAQRFPNQEQLLVRSGKSPGPPGRRRSCIPVQTLFERIPLTSAVSPVIDDQDMRLKAVQDLNPGDPMRDIAGIAVKHQERSVAAHAGYKPAVQFHSVFSDQGKVLECKPDSGRIAHEGSIGVIDEESLQCMRFHDD